jgi:hypothetical protein
MSPPDRTVSLDDWIDSLEDFKSEQTPPGSPPAPSPTERSDRAVSLAELRSLGVRIESHEAVAVIEALCERMIESTEPVGAAGLDASAIFIHRSGEVTAASGGPHNPSAVIQCLGQILSEILPDDPQDDFLFLRVRVVTRATASPPAYASLQELSQTLACYERPDRTRVIQEVYERWQDRHRQPTGAGHLVAPVKPLVAAIAATLPIPHLRPAVAALGLAALGVGVWTLWPARPEETRQAVGSSSVARGTPLPVATASQSTAVPAIPPTTSRAGGNGVEVAITEARREAGPLVPARRPPPLVIRSRGLATAAGAAPVSSSPASEPATAPAEPPPSVPAPAAISTSAPPALVAPDASSPPDTGRTGPADEVRVPDLATYSASDRDVIPPAVLYSQLLGPPRVAVVREDLAAIEVLVGENGTVESVKATDRPRNIGESILLANSLSTAKAWRFRPALRDGRPVKYRLIVALASE